MKNIPNFQKYFDEDILNIRDLKHNGNNQLFEISTNLGNFMLKQYARFHMHNWQRGHTEFKALSYLWRKGFREIPRPISFYEKENIAIYSYEEGRVLKSSEVKEKDIIQLTDFLVKVHNLDNKDKICFPAISSACLNLQEYVNVLDKRIESLFDYEIRDSVSKKAKDFFNRKVIPKIKELKNDFYNKTKEYDLEKELSIDDQVLTPGDLGFHNILHNTGECKFIDFEYFGRDDPVRQILHFLNHDKSSDIDEKLKTNFLNLYMQKRNLSESFKERLELVNPFIKMDWVLIISNVFCKGRIENLDLEKSESKQKLEQRLSNAQKRLSEI